MNKKYYMNFEDSQDYIQKRGLDIPWNDCDVFIDERAITRTVGNVLLWADEHPIHYDGQAMLGVYQGKQEWTDEDEENFQHTLLAIRKSTWYTDSDKKELKEFVVSLKQRLTDDTQGNRTGIVQSLS